MHIVSIHVTKIFHSTNISFSIIPSHIWSFAHTQIFTFTIYKLLKIRNSFSKVYTHGENISAAAMRLLAARFFTLFFAALLTACNELIVTAVNKMATPRAIYVRAANFAVVTGAGLEWVIRMSAVAGRVDIKESITACAVLEIVCVTPAVNCTGRKLTRLVVRM